jgi:hypothetical protein
MDRLSQRTTLKARNHSSTRGDKAVKSLAVHAIVRRVALGDVGEVVVALQHATVVEGEFLDRAVDVD